MTRSVILLVAAASLLAGCQFGSTSASQKAIDHYVAAQLLLEQDNSDAALVELFKAVEIDPDLASAHAAIGGVHLEQDDAKAATVAYERAVAANPYDENIAKALATCYDRLGRADDASRIRSKLAAAGVGD